MVLDFDVQMGVTKIPDLTADGRDGFSSRAQHDWCVERYLGGMCDKKRGKALIDKSMYERILAVLFDKNDKTTESAQFRWWVRRTFTKVSDDRGHYLVHENRPLAVKEQIYDVLVYCHAECGHGGRDKTSAVSRKYFSWIPKDVVSRFVSVCPGCHARTQKDEQFFSAKGADGYYPVNDQVRELSIVRGHATPESYAKTSPYQPLLAAGMVKLLNGVNHDEESTVGAIGFDADELSSASQNSHLSPFDINGHDQSQSSIQDSSVRVEGVLGSGQPVSRVPSPHPQPTHDLQNNLERAAVANAQAVMAKVALRIKTSEIKNLKADQHKIQATKLAQGSKIRAPKTSRKTQVRKPTSKPKVHKKATLTEPGHNPLPSSSVCSDTLPRLQEDSSATSTSEDDNTSKSEIASPTQFYSLIPPRFDYSIQAFSGGMELNNRKHRESLSPDHEAGLNNPTSHHNTTNLLGLEHVQTPIPCVDVIDNMMLREMNQSTQGWQAGGRSEGFNRQDSSYGSAYQGSIHKVSEFQSSSTPTSNDTTNAGIHSQDLSFQQYAQLVDQHNNNSIDHNSAGIEFTFQSVQSSAPESQLCHSLTPLHTSTPLSWSLSAPTNGGVGDGFNGMLQGSPHPSFLTDDNTQYQDMLNAAGSQGSPYMSEISVDYQHQVPQLVEQTKHRPPMLQLPPSQFSLDPSQNGPHSAPLLGGHFDYAQRTEPNYINYPYSAGFDGHFDFHAQNQYPYSIDPATLTQDFVGGQYN
ncbi:uncharacterized protein MELLADRAFT_114026 [Melampsora larici-populina 98AG31]|uniref:Integrase zinc-binding domain-containing protein n=1 Tax=Melampsora larici-populina (strain 98AG31 / pathotype 3-4-7) TaxID=747676 RepID=F4SBW9_MELLP|nr:uncharacterized protein MELLADRAFT_114026 [Melampsora larici-populina 98AG31]EGF97858.1 hypothetical protein MELLADRAFT_114026 [Melampsora larici-populina 98AG31]